jgi:hypothetical protein
MSNCTLNYDSANSTPLAWWRCRHAHELAPRDVGGLRRAMRGIHIFDEPGWNAAFHGDAAQAIGIAIRVAIKQPCTEPVIDLLMSAVLCTAIEGDEASQHFLAHMLRRRGAMEPPAQSLAASWIAASLTAAQARRAAKPHVRMRSPRSRHAANRGRT